MIARCRCDTLIPYRNINQTNSLLLLYERNASLPSIYNLVSVTVAVSLCFCSCPFPCVPECLFWFPRSLPLCSHSCHGPCPFPCVPAPITVPMSLFFFLSLPMFLSLFLTLSLCPCVLVSRPLSLQLYSVIFCSMSTSDPPSSDNSLVSQLRLKEATILVTFVETLVTLRPPLC